VIFEKITSAKLLLELFDEGKNRDYWWDSADSNRRRWL